MKTISAKNALAAGALLFLAAAAARADAADCKRATHVHSDCPADELDAMCEVCEGMLSYCTDYQGSSTPPPNPPGPEPAPPPDPKPHMKAKLACAGCRALCPVKISPPVTASDKKTLSIGCSYPPCAPPSMKHPGAGTKQEKGAKSQVKPQQPASTSPPATPQK
jgi:hypothetical protein